MRHDTVESWYANPSTRFTSGPDRIYDSSAAAEPLPPKRPLGFVKTSPVLPTRFDVSLLVDEPEPLLWEGDQA
jgi:hypothetical protein